VGGWAEKLEKGEEVKEDTGRHLRRYAPQQQRRGTHSGCQATVLFTATV
jgi:hypothetical protein